MEQRPIQVAIDYEQRHHGFVVEHYRNRFKTTPKKSDLLLTASQQSDIVGTIALGYGQGKEASFYDAFDVSAQDLVLFEKRHVEFGRWISLVTRPKVSEILLSTAVVVSLAAGYELAFVQQRPALERILKNTGIRVKRVNAELNLKEVRPADLPFYLEQTPVLNYFDLAEAVRVLKPRLDQQIEAGVVEALNIPSLTLEVEV